MYPCISERSCTKPLHRLSPSNYSVPSTKLRNVICVLCKSKFCVPDLSNLNLNGSISRGTLIPLLLDCGHPICNKCINVKFANLKKCPKCDKIIENCKSLRPLNLHALGLIISSYHRPLENDEEFLFCHKLSSQLRQITKKGSCHECGNQANVKCPQCMALYCYSCYSKIHGRALQNHTQIPICDGSSNSPASILNSCSSTCSEALSYFCNDCNVACCSNCTLCSHKLHNYVSLSEKNQTLIPEFNEIYEHIEETLQRVYQTKEKIKSAFTSNTYKLENGDIIEAALSQHFAYLHGVLQNMEAKLINQLYEQGNRLKNNLENIELQLQSQEEKLKFTMQLASYAEQTFHKVDIGNAINILTEMADLPCHLMYKDSGQNNKAKFTIDDSIVEAIENHCTITVPPVSSYSLVRKEELPTNYIMSPLPKKPQILESSQAKLEQAIMRPVIQSEQKLDDSLMSTISIEIEDKEEEILFLFQGISECKVEVTYVVDPSLFFVRKVAMKAKFLQLEKDLMAYGNDEENLKKSINIKQNDMCIVKQWKVNEWYRGCVNTVMTNSDGETSYNVVYIDYGYEECNIAASRVRKIAEHLQTLPPQAIRCCLNGLKPKNLHWTNASTNDFMKLTNGVDCMMSIIKSTPDILHVDLRVNPKNSNMGPQSMCSTMKIMDYAHLDSRKNPKNTLTTYVYNREELPLNKSTAVIIGWLESPYKIYVSKATRQNKFLKLKDELNEYYTKETSVKIIETLQKGVPCAIQLEDDTWQRGEIIEIISENQVRVFCVDWGCTLIQDRDALRMIPYEYTTFKAQAIKISLMYIMPEANGTWKQEAVISLLNLFSNTKSIMVNPRKKTDDGYIGLMYSNNIDVSRQLKITGVVNDYVVSNKFKNKLQKKPQSDVKNNVSLLEKSDNNTIKDFCISYNTENDKSMKEETPKDPFKVEVRIQRVITPDCIYVAQMEHEQENEKLMLKMQKFYDKYHSEPRNNWSEGALCTVYSAKDKSYFRAKILKIKSSTEVLVYLYDMGIEETVTMKDIQVLHPQFAEEMTYCFKVKLAGILPCGGSSTWPSLSCTTLSEIIQNNAYCKFYITKPVHEEFSDDIIPVELWVRQSKIPGPLAPTQIEINSINRMLVEKGVALPIKNYFAKADSILAEEFKQQLETSHWGMPNEENVEWLDKDPTKNELDVTMTSCPWQDRPRIELDLIPSAPMTKHKVCDSTNREGSVKFSDWLPPIEITEEVFHAITTYVDVKCMVYLHSKKYNADLLNYIETELQNYCKKVKTNKEKQWKEGEICIAQYHYNQKWYRGRIVDNLGNVVKVEFVDYGNVEECKIEHVTDDIRLGHIPIQCTKCVISGLRPASPNGKWKLIDLDRIHALLVDQECKVSILQRQPTNLIVSITLLRPWKSDLLLYLSNHMDMDIKIERKSWNDSDNSENEDFNSTVTLNTTRDVVIEETISDYEKLCITDISKKSSNTNNEDITLNENVISGNLETTKTELLDKLENKRMISDTESISSIDTNILNTNIICSTPQPSEDEDYMISYKRLIIPQDTKYIELILCCNKDPITSLAQLAENNDDIFSDKLHEYYLQYESVMSEMQTNRQPLIESFAKNTPCIAKFTDNMWYRCIITNSEKILNTQYIKISLYYVDFGNHEYIQLHTTDIFSKNYDLRVPKEEWLELPAMAIKCTFWGLNFVSNDIDLLASKLDEIYNEAVVARVKKIIEGNHVVVEVYKDKMCTELFYADLIKEGLYQFNLTED
ncbi:PREDICTED: RING finger protein 17-like isoform X2 [Acromyrmex echinatior]|uniref:RING finger protein 17-like isoform X2 n=1 Tax=Acromyrmex echinatior TaxID=103372 RepID=UPI000580F8CA|nr:PREDICTED: RING finger protein 17-like isoform X2 [Acromyrmex echinatior]